MRSQPPGPTIRRVNQRAVLQALHVHDGPTVTDLMTSTGLSRPTVHTVCDELQDAGLVLEVDSGQHVSGPGRRPRSFALNARAACVVGIDAGATSVRAELTDLRGTVLSEAHFTDLTMATSADERLAAIRECITEAITRSDVAAADVRAIGIGMPAPVGHDNRVIALPQYLRDLPETDVAAAISGRDGWRVLLENDANLAVLAESRSGVARDVDDVVAVLAGERLGAGVMLDGRLLRGATGATGELSFAALVRGVDSTDGIGRLAREAGRTALTAAGRSATTALLQRCGGDPARLTSEDVFAAAAGGDELARQALAQATTPAGQLITVLHLLLDPATIVISGAVAEAPGLVDALTAQLPDMEEQALHPLTLRASTLGGRAVTVGATSMAIDDVWAQLSENPRLLAG